MSRSRPRWSTAYNTEYWNKKGKNVCKEVFSAFARFLIAYPSETRDGLLMKPKGPNFFFRGFAMAVDDFAMTCPLQGNNPAGRAAEYLRDYIEAVEVIATPVIYNDLQAYLYAHFLDVITKISSAVAEKASALTKNANERISRLQRKLREEQELRQRETPTSSTVVEPEEGEGTVAPTGGGPSSEPPESSQSQPASVPESSQSQPASVPETQTDPSQAEVKVEVKEEPESASQSLLEDSGDQGGSGPAQWTVYGALPPVPQATPQDE